jgi:MFS family permease
MTATVSTQGTGETSARAARDVRRLRRVAAAVVLLLPGPAAAVSRLFPTDDSDTRAALDLIAADPARQSSLALLGYVTLLTVVPAFLAAARLAQRRRPVLTTIAIAMNLLGCLSGWAPLALDTMYLAGSRVPVEQRDGAAALIDAMWSEGLTSTSVTTVVIGQLVGPILMALALRGSIPTVGWVAMILSPPVLVLAFVADVFDPAALFWGLMALAFTCCAITVLRTPDDTWDLPPAR